METAFQTLDFPTALTVTMLSAFAIALRVLWKYFTDRIEKLETRIDELYKENASLYKKYDALWTQMSIDVLKNNDNRIKNADQGPPH